MLQHGAHLRSALLAVVPHQTGRLVVIVVVLTYCTAVPAAHVASHGRHPFRTTPGGVDVHGSVLAATTTDDLMWGGCTSSVVHLGRRERPF